MDKYHFNCKYYLVKTTEEPCKTCMKRNMRENWESKEPKEEKSMSKIMSTGEMYNYAKEHPEAKFKRLPHGCIYHFNKDGRLMYEGNAGFYPSYDFPKLDEQWELIPQAVDFMTAINSGKPITSESRKTIKCSPEWLLTRLSLEEINGKWLIED